MVKVIDKLHSELNDRFKRVLDPRDGQFDPIYLVATLLDIRYALLLDGDLLDIAKNELKMMVSL